MEYASEVWDNCGQINSDRLEKVQLEAARIVRERPFNLRGGLWFLSKKIF